MTQASLAERLLDSIRSGDAPLRARLAAARGALPLAPAELVAAQALLIGDSEKEVREAAAASLEALEPDSARRLAVDRETPAAVLSFLARAVSRWPEAGALLARRSDLTGEVLGELANAPEGATLEALADNHVALRAAPDLGRRLLDNSALPEGARTRLLDVLEEVDKERSARMPAAKLAPEQEESEQGPPLARDPFLASLGVDAEVEALLPTLGLEIGQLAERSELLGEFEELGDDEGLIKRLSNMNVGQKLRVALFGGKEERTILVRDSNRIVAAAVVKNPKFTEQEADAVAKSRNVSDEVLRLIGRSKEVSKNSKIQLSLIQNPRTPIEIAMHFINQRNDRELSLLMKNRNISDAVRRQAKKIYLARESRRRVRLRPGKH